MKTTMKTVQLLLVLVLAVSATGAFAQTSNTPDQTVCISTQPYRVDLNALPGATYTWNIAGGTAGVNWQISVTPGAGNEITVNWMVAGNYVLSVITSANGCDGLPQSVNVTVVPQPVGPTLLATSTPYPDVCAGSDVWATFTAGSGGVGCTDEFRYSYDNLTWLPYTGGNMIPAIPGETHIYIQGRRTGCDAVLGCVGTDWVELAQWNITTLVVTVSITANPNPVCTGSPVTFTATPVNGGLTPTYVWRVNGVVDPSSTTNTFTYVPANGDVVDCDVLSSETCGAPNPATSNSITVTVNPIPTTTPIWHN